MQQVKQAARQNEMTGHRGAAAGRFLDRLDASFLGAPLRGGHQELRPNNVPRERAVAPSLALHGGHNSHGRSAAHPGESHVQMAVRERGNANVHYARLQSAALGPIECGSVRGPEWVLSARHGGSAVGQRPTEDDARQWENLTTQRANDDVVLVHGVEDDWCVVRKPVVGAEVPH